MTTTFTSRSRWLSLASLLALAPCLPGCIDFGYRVATADSFRDAGVDAPTDAGDAGEIDTGPAIDGGDLDAPPACVEGAVAPSDMGPQVHFITLNVDQPVLTINAGDVVTWTNTDSMRHTATAGAPGAIVPADRGGFVSGDIAPGGRWAFRFCNPRTVIWFCETHAAQMNGYRIVIGG